MKRTRIRKTKYNFLKVEICKQDRDYNKCETNQNQSTTMFFSKGHHDIKLVLQVFLYIFWIKNVGK